MRGPERRHRGADAKRDGAVPCRHGRVDRTPNVVLVGGQVAHDLRLAGAADVGLHAFDPKGEPGPVANGQFVVLTDRFQLDGRQLADRLEHRPAFRQLGVRNEQRGTGQVAEDPGDVASHAGQAAAHIGDRLGCPTARECSEPGEEAALAASEQVEAPLQGGAQRLVARRCGPPPVRQ